MATARTTNISDIRGGPGIFVRILWFLFVGWWLSFAWITLSTAVNLTIIGIPLGLWMANRVPQVATLKFDSTRYTAEHDGNGNTKLTISNVPQRPFWQRALWYLLVGWWFTTVWLYLAWLLCVTIILIPVAFPMFSATGKLLTLRRG